VVQAVVDHFGLDRVDLAGSSFGGLYAYNFALAQPQRVRSIVQLGSPGGPTVLGMPTMFRFLSLPLPGPMVNRALRPDPKEARKMFADVGHEAAVASGAMPDVIFDWYASLLCDTDTVPNLLHEIRAIASPLGYRGLAKLDDEAIASIRQPLLYLWGDNDPFAKPERADALAALGSNAMIEHFEDFGHLPWYDDASLIAGRVDEFLSSVAA